MSEKLERENRYLVLKRRDIISKLLTPEARSAWDTVEKFHDEIRKNNGKGPLCCVVVEHDWPEYEIVWAMIEARMSGKPTEIDDLRQQLADSQAENETLKEFVCHLKDGAHGFTEELAVDEDLISAHNGFYVAYDKVIKACGGGCYGSDPLELIGTIINERDELEQKVCDSCLEYEDDGTPLTTYGWNENREEGQIPCGCISESGPYQVLDKRITELEEALENDIMCLCAEGVEFMTRVELAQAIIKIANKALKGEGHE
jgi:hypothetical protein